MNRTARMAILIGIVVLAAVGATGYILRARAQQQADLATTSPVAVGGDVISVSARPHLVFRSTALGNGYGQVALVALTDPGGARVLTPASCERVYATGNDVLCLSADRGLVTTYASTVLGRDWRPLHTLPLTGLPSRARLSPDGSLAATTTFVFGDSYTNPGQFSTRTIVSRTDGSMNVDLEQFQLTVNGTTISAADRNLWGVTFADKDQFYATAASGGKTWLVRGSLTERRLTAIREDVECPSLSPDGTLIAFKRHGNLPAGQWRLAVYDLRTGTESVLAETRSVDDQPEWLDNSHVIYGLPRTVAGTASSDVWMVPITGAEKPLILVPDAWSPTVVRCEPSCVNAKD